MAMSILYPSYRFDHSGVPLKLFPVFLQNTQHFEVRLLIGRYQVLGTKYLVPSTWYQVPGTKYLVPGTWYRKVTACGKRQAAVSGKLKTLIWATLRQR